MWQEQERKSSRARTSLLTNSRWRYGFSRSEGRPGTAPAVALASDEVAEDADVERVRFRDEADAEADEADEASEALAAALLALRAAKSWKSRSRLSIVRVVDLLDGFHWRSRRGRWADRAAVVVMAASEYWDGMKWSDAMTRLGGCAMALVCMHVWMVRSDEVRSGPRRG
jgi:hypothetical protein